MSNKIKWIKFIIYGCCLVCIGLAVFFQNNAGFELIIGIVIAGMLVLVDHFAPQLIHLSSDNPKIKTMRRIIRFSIIVMLFSIILNFWFPETVSKILKKDGIIETLLIAGIILVFGNVAPKLPCNSYVGMRWPWTVCNEKAWRAGHRLLGYISFPTAFAIVLGKLFFQISNWSLYCMLFWVIVPAFYSLWIYYKDKKERS